jgi:trimeric autotransporter adhesin
MKKVIILLFLSVIVLASCGGGGSSSTAAKVPASITVTPANNTLSIGKTQQFTAIVKYSDGTTQDLTPSVIWRSSDINKATIASNGIVTTVAVGDVQITADLGGVKDTTTLTVASKMLVSIAVSPATPSIALGSSQQFTATGTYSDGTTQDLNLTTSPSITWKSSDTTVATIDSSGKATASASVSGPTTITAAVGSVSGTTTLAVIAASVQSIAITPANPSIAAGTTQQFIATGTLLGGATQDLTTSVIWISDNPLDTITSNGLVTTGTVGATSRTTTITAMLGGKSDSTTLTVTPETLAYIDVTSTRSSISAGTTLQFTATGNFSDGSHQVLTASATWRSSDSAVATIDSSGKVTAEGIGTTTITATLEGVQGAFTLAVTPLTLDGTWIGNYTILSVPAPLDPSQLINNPYMYQFTYNQNGTWTATLRGNTLAAATSKEFTIKVDGRKISFSFQYPSPQNPSYVMVNNGEATIEDNKMTGAVDENFNGASSGGFNCRYIFTLTKQ